MADTSNGGPAFPCDQDPLNCYPGMTLRDWFASQALIGVLGKIKTDQISPRFIAQMSYELADVMIAEKKEFEEFDK